MLGGKKMFNCLARSASCEAALWTVGCHNDLCRLQASIPLSTRYQNHKRSYPCHRLRPSLYFFVAAASSALAFALFSLTPTNLASLLASLNLLYAPSSPSGISSLLTSVTASSLLKFLIGNTPWTCFAAFSFSNLEISSLLLSAPLYWPERRGKRIKRSR